MQRCCFLTSFQEGPPEIVLNCASKVENWCLLLIFHHKGLDLKFHTKLLYSLNIKCLEKKLRNKSVKCIELKENGLPIT